MIRVACPTGCKAIPRPYRARVEPVRCANCRAWFRVDAAAEDGSFVTGVLIAAPGATPLRARSGRPWSIAIAAALVVAAGVIVAFAR